MTSDKFVFLLSFGHCGIDWVHSLLNGHSRIMIMPLFSYYRTRKLINADQAKTKEETLAIWKKHFDTDSFQEEADGKFFYSEIEKDKFYSYLDKHLNDFPTRKELFICFHEAYAFCKGINLENIDKIVVHEHVCFPFDDIYEDFNDDLKLLIIQRDPRAAIVGYFKGMNRKFANRPDFYDHYFNMSFEEWLLACEIWNKHKASLKDNIFLLKNEELSQDTLRVMKDVANWLGTSFEESLTICKFLDGSPWKLDSCYVGRNEKNKDDDFFSPEKIEARWRGVLSDKREILMIESLFHKYMDEFGYKKDNEINFLNKLKGYFYFLLPHRGIDRLKYYSVSEEEVERYHLKVEKINCRFQKLLLPQLGPKLKNIYIHINSMGIRFKALFFPGRRWDRYDHT